MKCLIRNACPMLPVAREWGEMDPLLPPARLTELDPPGQILTTDPDRRLQTMTIGTVGEYLGILHDKIALTGEGNRTRW